MTVIQPEGHKRSSRIMNSFLAMTLAMVLGWGILIYNAMVNLNHNIRLLEVKIQKTEAVNAELKNKLYAFLNPSSLEAVARKRGLVKEKGPHYFETAIAPWLSAFQQ